MAIIHGGVATLAMGVLRLQCPGIFIWKGVFLFADLDGTVYTGPSRLQMAN